MGACTCRNDTPTKASNRTSPSHSTLRVACPATGCTSAFARPSDLTRHQRSIHGPKTSCVYLDCEYATGRVDKMKEHVRKIHGDTGELNEDGGGFGREMLSRRFNTGTSIINRGWTGASPESQLGFDRSQEHDYVSHYPYFVSGGGYFQENFNMNMPDFGNCGLGNTAWNSTDPTHIRIG